MKHSSTKQERAKQKVETEEKLVECKNSKDQMAR